MKLLIDTNIILDVMLKREPFYEEAVEILNLADRDDIYEYVSASAFTDIYYIARRSLKDKDEVRALLWSLLDIVSVATVSEKEVRKALALDWNDFEDSVQYTVAMEGQIDGIVTRNLSDYRGTDVQIWQPEQILRRLSGGIYGDKVF